MRAVLGTDERLAPGTSARLAIALSIGVLAGIAASALQGRAGFTPDFVYPWRAAGALLAGRNPYVELPGGAPAPFQAPLLYPLPAVMLVTPLARLPLAVAGGIFCGVSAALLAFLVTREGYAKLPMFVSAPFFMALSLGQWSPLIMTAALLPALGVLLVAKPNLGLAIFAYRPNRTAVIASAALLALSLALLPHWPLDWLHSLALDRRSATHPIPLLTPLGAVLVLALLRWRRPEARLLFAMACVPQLLFFYDQLALWLVPRSSRESLWLTLASGLAFLAMILLAPTDAERPRVAAQCVLLGVYWPALGMVLRRPNVATDSGDARPSRAERDRERETEGEIAGARAR